MTNDEFPMTKEIRNLKSEAGTPHASTISWAFVLRTSFDIRHLDFVIFRRHDSNAECGMRKQATDNGPLTTNHERFEIRLLPIAEEPRLHRRGAPGIGLNLISCRAITHVTLTNK